MFGMRGTTQFDWTDERVETLKKLWSEGLSASQIAKEMNCKSRSAVIGKVHRLNLPTRDKKTSARKAAYVPRERRPRDVGFRQPRVARAAVTATTDERTKQQRMDDAERMRAMFAAEAGPIEGGVSFAELGAKHCRWPMGDPSNLETFRLCGEPKMDGCPYCNLHRLMSIPAHMREVAE